MTAFAGEVHPLAEVWPMLPDDDLAVAHRSCNQAKGTKAVAP